MCVLSHYLPFYLFTIPTKLKYSRIYTYIPVIFESPQDSTETFFHHNIKTNVLWLIFIFFYHYTAVNIDWSYIVYQMLSHIILHTVAHDLIRPLVVLILLQMRKHTASCLRSQTIAQENKSWVNAKSSACATNGWSWNSCTGVLYAHFSII